MTVQAGLCHTLSETQIVGFVTHRLKSKLSSFIPVSMSVQASLCWTWSEIQIVGFLMKWLIFVISRGAEESCSQYDVEER